jgi:uncharacterized protein YkwD
MLRVPHIRTTFIVIALTALCAVAATPAAAAKRVSKAKVCANANSEPDGTNAWELGVSAVCLLNNERAERGLVRVKLNSKLSAAAVEHNNDMVRNHYFEHVAPNGSNVIERVLHTGYLKRTISWLLGENLAWGTGTFARPRDIVKAWMNSPGHRHNILTRRFREIGIAVALDAPQVRAPVAATYTTVFGIAQKK